MKFAYRRGYGFPGLDPDDLGAILDVIAKKNGGVVTTTALKEAARNKKHRCHPYVFDKDVEAAAEAHFDQNAMRMIRSIYIIVAEKPDAMVPAWFNITGSPDNDDLGDRVLDRGYRGVGEVLSSAPLRQEALRKVWERLLQLRRLYEHMTELAPVWDAMKSVEPEIDKKKAVKK